MAGEDRTQLDGNGARQTDLTSMGVPTQQKVEPSMRGVAIDLRSMRKEYRKSVVWNVCGGLFDVVDSVEMCVVNTGQIDTVAIARNGLALIEQHPNSHLFETGNHTNRVMIAQHSIYWLSKKRPQPIHVLKCRLERAKGRPAIVPGHHTHVISQIREKLCHTSHRAFADIDVEIAQVEHGEPVEAARQLAEKNMVVSDLDVFGVPLTSPIEPAQFEGVSNKPMS